MLKRRGFIELLIATAVGLLAPKAQSVEALNQTAVWTTVGDQSYAVYLNEVQLTNVRVEQIPSREVLILLQESLGSE